MKILLTGATGMLGRALRENLSLEHEVIPLAHADLDITDLPATLSALGRSKPQVVIHAGAWTDVDGC